LRKNKQLKFQNIKLYHHHEEENDLEDAAFIIILLLKKIHGIESYIRSLIYSSHYIH